jgi:hypothetical protein
MDFVKKNFSWINFFSVKKGYFLKYLIFLKNKKLKFLFFNFFKACAIVDDVV